MSGNFLLIITILEHYTPGSDVSFEVSVLIDPKNPKRYYMELPRSS